MAQKTNISKVLSFIGAVVTIWAFSNLVLDASREVASFALGQPEWLALTLIGCCFLAYANWRIFWRIIERRRAALYDSRPDVQFKRLHDDLRELLRDAETNYYSPRSRTRVSLHQMEVIRKLAKLGIPAPSINDIPEYDPSTHESVLWVEYLINMTHYANHSDINKAQIYGKSFLEGVWRDKKQ